MASLPLAIELLQTSHLEALIASSAAESATLEFKSAPYASDHEGVREFLKDVTALANTAGGWIFIGVREEGGAASGFQPLALETLDALKLRLESLLQTAVEPRMFGIGLKAVPVDGGAVLAIRAPKSQAPPHRVTAKNSNRFYLRSSAGAYEASMDELRAMFLQTAALQERVTAFRDQRLAALEARRAPIQLAETQSKLVLHVVPLSALNPLAVVDLRGAEKRSGAFRPMRATGWNSNYNMLGFLSSRGGGQCHGYTQVFREGMLEAVYCGIARGEATPQLSPVGIATTLLEYVPMYVDALGEIGATPSFFVSVSIVGVAGAHVLFDPYRWSVDPLPLTEDLLLPIALIPDFGSEEAYASALKPAFDALWNAGGLPNWSPEAMS